MAISIFSRAITNPRVLEDRIIKDGSYNIDQGVGVRAISGEKTGFAYADQISLLALEQSARPRALLSVTVVMEKYKPRALLNTPRCIPLLIRCKA